MAKILTKSAPFLEQITTRKQFFRENGIELDGVEIALNKSFAGETLEAALRDPTKFADERKLEEYAIVTAEAGDLQSPGVYIDLLSSDETVQKNSIQHVRNCLTLLDELDNGAYLVIHMVGDCRIIDLADQIEPFTLDKLPYIRKHEDILNEFVEAYRELNRDFSGKLIVENVFQGDFTAPNKTAHHEIGSIYDFIEKGLPMVVDIAHLAVNRMSYNAAMENKGIITTSQGTFEIYIPKKERAFYEAHKDKSLQEQILLQLEEIPDGQVIDVHVSNMIDYTSNANHSATYGILNLEPIIKELSRHNPLWVTEVRDEDYTKPYNQVVMGRQVAQALA